MDNDRTTSVAVARLAKRRRWTEAEARVVLATVSESGGSLIAFCRQHGLDAQRIHWWRARLRASRSRPRAPRFVPVRVIPSLPAVESAIDEPCELISPRGWRIRLSRALDAAHLEQVVRILVEAGC